MGGGGGGGPVSLHSFITAEGTFLVQTFRPFASAPAWLHGRQGHFVKLSHQTHTCCRRYSSDNFLSCVLVEAVNIR